MPVVPPKASPPWFFWWMILILVWKPLGDPHHGNLFLDITIPIHGRPYPIAVTIFSIKSIQNQLKSIIIVYIWKNSDRKDYFSTVSIIAAAIGSSGIHNCTKDCGYNLYHRKVIFSITILSDVHNKSNRTAYHNSETIHRTPILCTPQERYEYCTGLDLPSAYRSRLTCERIPIRCPDWQS